MARYLRGYVDDPAHGPLLGLLLLLTATTGMVDAVTILRLGKVFTANMTGNTVFVGLGAVGAPGFSWIGSLVALVSFGVGAVAGGVVGRGAADRARLLGRALGVQALVMLASVIMAAVHAVPANVIVALLAFSFGVQNAAVQLLKVPDLTTSVMTRTITALLVDVRHARGEISLRRLLSVVCIAAGAVAGGLLVQHVGVAATLAVVLLVQLAVIAVVALETRRPAAWQAL